MTPTIIMDIDGVLAPMGMVPDRDLPLDVDHDWGAWVVRERDALLLGQLVSGAWGPVNFIWGSSWEGDSNLLADGLGLGPFPHVPHGDADQGPHAWRKAAPFLEFIGQTQGPVLWVDDELDTPTIALAEADHRIRCLVPDGHLGLTPENWDEIVAFLGNRPH